MRLSHPLILAALLSSACGSAFAVPTGNEVSVNPLPAGGNRVLLYPGGQYMRVIQPLREPGQAASDNAPIQLHMPGKKSAALPRATAAVAPRSIARQAAAPSVAAAPKQAAAPPASPARKAAANPAPRSSPAYGAFGAPSDSILSQSIVAQAQSATAPKQQLAKATPPPAAPAPSVAEPGLNKQSVILFAAGAAEPAQSALGSIKFLAGDLNAAMVGPSSRIQLLAYGGDKGDKGSDARRLSLKRALAIRQVLIDDGVPSERIDVHAMGGADDGGPADRVDVYIKA
jgi:outer membrane protein OmpA-like peptidoglycan-associated protein